LPRCWLSSRNGIPYRTRSPPTCARSAARTAPLIAASHSPAGVPRTPNTTCSRYVGSGHPLRDKAGPCSTRTSRPHQVDRPREPGPVHKRAIAGRLRGAHSLPVTCSDKWRRSHNAMWPDRCPYGAVILSGRGSGYGCAASNPSSSPPARPSSLCCGKPATIPPTSSPRCSTSPAPPSTGPFSAPDLRLHPHLPAHQQPPSEHARLRRREQAARPARRRRGGSAPRPPPARTALRRLCLPGQSRLHFTKERDDRRRQILTAILDLGVVVDLRHATGIRNQQQARAACLRARVQDLAAAGGQRLVLEQDDAPAQRPDVALRRGPRRRRQRPAHQRAPPARAEPLLWVADATAWCWSRGGPWPSRLQAITRHTRTLCPASAPARTARSPAHQPSGGLPGSLHGATAPCASHITARPRPPARPPLPAMATNS